MNINTVVQALGMPALVTDKGIEVRDGNTYRPLTAEEQARVRAEETLIQEQEYREAVQNMVQDHINAVATAHGYDDIVSVRSWTSFPNEFQRECLRISMWAGDVWKFITDLEKEVKSGKRPLPTLEDIPAMLPEYQE